MDSKSDKYGKNQDVIDFSIADFIKICLNKWYWFAISIVCAIGIALFYIYIQQPVYERSEAILITDNDSGGGGIAGISDAFSSLGLFSSNSNVNNELISLTSPALIYEVAERLKLDYNYKTKEGIRTKTLYGDNLPITVELPEIEAQQATSFRIELMPDGSKKLWKFVAFTPDGKIKYDDEITLSAQQNEVKTPIGTVRILLNPEFKGLPLEDAMEIRFNKMPMQMTVELYETKLMGDLIDQDADVIELSIKDVSVQRAVDILNTVLDVYNQNWIDDKNKMAMATSAFIDDRLNIIQQELGDVDANIAAYLQKSGTPDIITSAEISMEKQTKLDQQVIEINNELSMMVFMRDFVAEHSDNSALIPLNMDNKNRELNAQIVEYNDLLMARNNLIANSSANNPFVETYDIQLKELYVSILQALNNQVAQLQLAMNNLKDEHSKINSKMAGTSMEALPLLSEERQQKVKEGLYLFLLQKREENELSQKFTADNVRIIYPPMGSLDPVSPRKALILVIAFLLGLGVPLFALYLAESSNNKIQARKDLDTVKMPFAGEIPQVGRKTKIVGDKVNIGKKNKEEKAPLAVVEEGKRDVVNEAFRVIRSNLDFMMGKNAGSQVIMLTSFNPGSGKSFISYNLALSFAIKGKKVLIVDCDLRHGSSSMYVGSPEKGLAGYLADNIENWQSCVKHIEANPNLSILPTGKMPPNPVELLESERFAEMITEARKDYDIIFLDCPPVNIVVDTQVVGQFADKTLFVVRAGVLEKSALSELNDFYVEKKFPSMSVILNGTEAVHSRYYTYGTYQNFNK